MENIPITPRTKVGELLEAYPQLEAVLISVAPAFSALKNPVLRRTVGRVATLSQAAAVGGLKVDELVNRLRREAGQEAADITPGSRSYLVDTAPAWYTGKETVLRFDATPVINAGESPMAEILRLAASLGQDKVLEVKAPFLPAPVLDKLAEKGFRIFALEGSGTVTSYISPGEAG
ncbi:MAG: DUF1858 domain-containing protein [Bacteroidetes bacterium]|nr:DUF1858 domain-containing protein [Bacteroidota bacterium]